MNRYETDNYLFHFHEDTAAQSDILHLFTLDPMVKERMDALRKG